MVHWGPDENDRKADAKEKDVTRCCCWRTVDWESKMTKAIERWREDGDIALAGVGMHESQLLEEESLSVLQMFVSAVSLIVEMDKHTWFSYH